MKRIKDYGEKGLFAVYTYKYNLSKPSSKLADQTTLLIDRLKAKDGHTCNPSLYASQENRDVLKDKVTLQLTFKTK